jgi:peptidoglycan/LPS O-acetylase OafA/YrhL
MMPVSLCPLSTQLKPKEVVISQSPTDDKKKKIHLAHLDGIRGLAALYVVLHHAYLQSSFYNFQPWLQGATSWLYHGHNAVAIFIVLSGYCLMIPIARHGQIQGGILEFYSRRARRILPPYYFALLLSFLAIWAIPLLNQQSGTQWDTALPALNKSALLSHLFLVHNLDSKWIFQINPPLWSVAVEFQIYLLFPLILVPLFKRWGSLVTILAAFVMGFSPMLLLHRGEGTSPWFFGLFALGMAAAHYNFSNTPAVNRRLIFNSFLGVTLLFLLLSTLGYDLLNGHFYITDTACGLSTALFLAYYFDSATAGAQSKPVLKGVLESKMLVGLGTFSYSLYLIHMPILAWVDLTLRPLIPSPDARFAVLFGVGVPLCVALSYLFYIVVERRFTRSIKKERVEPSSVVS